MTREEAIKMIKAKLECMTRDVSGRDSDCIDHRCDECHLNYEQGNMGEQKEWLRMSIEALEAQPSEGEKVIRISKGTLKARTGKYVIYDVEWLKTHFNTTEAKIYGQPSEDCISRKAVLDGLANIAKAKAKSDAQKSLMGRVMFFAEHLPSVAPQPKTGHWIGHREHCEKLGVIPSGLGVYEWCSNCGHGIDIRDWSRISHNYCPKCGAKMQEVQK